MTIVEKATTNLQWQTKLSFHVTKCPESQNIITGKAEKAPMCSIHCMAMELEGLAGPGEALKNIQPPPTHARRLDS